MWIVTGKVSGNDWWNKHVFSLRQKSTEPLSGDCAIFGHFSVLLSDANSVRLISRSAGARLESTVAAALHTSCVCVRCRVWPVQPFESSFAAVINHQRLQGAPAGPDLHVLLQRLLSYSHVLKFYLYRADRLLRAIRRLLDLIS